MTFTTDFLDAAYGQKRYHHSGSLSGHDAPINALAFNTRGTLLASGGDNGEIRIWDTKTNQQVQTIMPKSIQWGQITHLKFTEVDRRTSAVDWLWIGTGRGFICVYRRSHTSPAFVELLEKWVFELGDAVEHFDVDNHFERFAVASHSGKVMVFQITNNELVKNWDERLPDGIPRGVAFVDNGTTLSIYTLETGMVYSKDAMTAKLTHSKQLKHPIGSIDVCRTINRVLIDNMNNGFDIYPVVGRGPVKTFPVESTQNLYVRSGAFGEGGRIAVCGSHQGKAYIFDVDGDGLEPTQVLSHGGRQGMIQTVTTNGNADAYLIATALSNGKTTIKLWKKQIRPQRKESKAKTSGLSTLQLGFNILLVLIVATMTFDTWLPTTKKHMVSLKARVSENTQHLVRTVPELHPVVEQSESNDHTVAEVLNTLDDETLRRLLSLKPATVVHVNEVWQRDSPIKVEASLSMPGDAELEGSDGNSQSTKTEGLTTLSKELDMRRTTI